MQTGCSRQHHSAEYKIRIVLEGLRGEDSIADLFRKEGIVQSLIQLSTQLMMPMLR
jgi:transposase